MDVVDLLGDPGGDLAGERHHVQPSGDRRRGGGEPLDLLEVVSQRHVGARVLHLHRHRFAGAGQPRPVHLPDRRGRGRARLELGEVGAPVRPEFGAQHTVHPRGGHRGSGVLQRGQPGPEWGGELLRQHRLHHRQHLAELHRPALELAQHAEQLLGGGAGQVGVHLVGGFAQQPAAGADGGPSGGAQRDAQQPGGAPQRSLREYCVVTGRKVLVGAVHVVQCALRLVRPPRADTRTGGAPASRWCAACGRCPARGCGR